MTQAILERLLTDAQDAHHTYETANPSHTDTWQTWYSRYVLDNAPVVRQYKQEAKGQFSIGLKQGMPHCGVDQTRGNFDYHVLIVWSAESLDSRGFLLDNTWFRDYFVTFRNVLLAISCERLCRLIADDIARECKERGMVACRVRISAIPGVWIEYECY